MNWLSSAIADWLSKEGVVPDADRDLFAYAAFCLAFGLIPLLMVAMLGAAMGMLQESCLMIAPYMLIRKFSGGYHLRSAWLCMVVSTIILGLSVYMVKVILTYGGHTLLCSAAFLSAIELWLFSPIEAPGNTLSARERRVYSFAAKAVSCTFLALYLALQSMGYMRWAIPIGMGMILTSLLQVPCLIRRIVHCGDAASNQH